MLMEIHIFNGFLVLVLAWKAGGKWHKQRPGGREKKGLSGVS